MSNKHTSITRYDCIDLNFRQINTVIESLPLPCLRIVVLYHWHNKLVFSQINSRACTAIRHYIVHFNFKNLSKQRQAQSRRKFLGSQSRAAKNSIQNGHVTETQPKTSCGLNRCTPTKLHIHVYSAWVHLDFRGRGTEQIRFFKKSSCGFIVVYSPVGPYIKY